MGNEHGGDNAWRAPGLMHVAQKSVFIERHRHEADQHGLLLADKPFLIHVLFYASHEQSKYINQATRTIDSSSIIGDIKNNSNRSKTRCTKPSIDELP